MKLISKSWTIPFKTDHDLKDIEDGLNGVLRTDFLEADKSIQNLCEILNHEGWEIKSVIPLISGMVFGTALLNSASLNFPGGLKSYGGGYGFGASYTEGVIVLAQKWINDINDELKEEHLGDDVILSSSKISHDQHYSASDTDSSILDLTGFEDNMNIDQLKEENPEDGFDPSKRILCSDGACIGVVNDKGFCKVCGKPYRK